MCDYSLHTFKNRLALEGEQLIVHRFPNSGCKGLASPEDLPAKRVHWAKRLANAIWPGWFDYEIKLAELRVVAVCVPPGARLRLSGASKQAQGLFGFKETEEVTLVHLALEPFSFRDGLKFNHTIRLPYDGKNKDPYVLSLQNMEPGIRIEVLELEIEEPARPTARTSYEQALGRSQRSNV